MKTIRCNCKNGKLVLEKTYKNGILDGLEKIYRHTGKLFRVSYHKQGDLIWCEEYFRRKEKVKERFTFGKRYIVIKKYDYNGRLKKRDIMDKKDEKLKEFFD